MQLEENTQQQVIVKNILNTLMVLFNHLRLYQEENRLVQLTTSRLFVYFETFFEKHGAFELVVARHGFLFNGEFVERSNRNFEKLANLFFMHGVATIQVEKGLATKELYAFLKVFNRKPADTWDEGGIQKCLEARRIGSIAVGELSEKNIQFLDDPGVASKDELLPRDKSDLWDRFALSIFQEQFATEPLEQGEELGATDLAQRTSAAVAGKSREEKLKLVKEIGDFLVFLQHENIRFYRTKAVEKITDFINNLSGDLKELFVQNAFNLTFRADFAEGFYSGLSDELIMDALKNAALGKQYVPPVVLNLLGKLAQHSGMQKGEGDTAADPIVEVMEQKTKTLFKSDDFEKYVPASYRQVLLKVVKSEQIDSDLADQLDGLKATLEVEQMEHHTARIVFEILRLEPDQQHMEGIRNNLEKFMFDCLERGDYSAALNWYRLGKSKEGDVDGTYAGLLTLIESKTFAERVLAGAHQFGKEKFEVMKELIVSIGDPFVAPLLDQLGGESNRSVRYLFLESLKSLGPQVIAEAGRRLQDKRWFFLRNIIVLLREIGDAAVLPLIRPLLRHPHPKVRFEAIKTCLQFNDGNVHRQLLAQLESNDPDEVVNAVVLARMSTDRRVVQRLLEMLEHSSLLHYRFEVKKNIVHTLAETGQQGALPLLRELLQGRSLLHPIFHEQLKLEIIRSLERFDSALVRDLLQQQAQTGSLTVARQASEVLQKIGGTPK